MLHRLASLGALFSNLCGLAWTGETLLKRESGCKTFDAFSGENIVSGFISIIVDGSERSAE